jgi:polyisoprenoid-binding protein YceI
MKLIRCLQCAALASIVALVATAHAELSTASGARVRFLANGTAMKFEGTTNDLDAEEHDGQLTLSVPLANLTTGIALRDRHMKEKYLEVQKFPKALLTVARGALKVPARGARVEADVAGTMQLHGQTRPVSVHYAAEGTGTSTTARGTVHLNMNDFGIVIPSYLGVTVKPDVDVIATFQIGGS